MDQINEYNVFQDHGKVQVEKGAINPSKIRQVRRSAVYQFGFLIPKDYKQALQLDEQNGNSKWYDATKLEMDQINEYNVFQDHGKVQVEKGIKCTKWIPENQGPPHLCCQT